MWKNRFYRLFMDVLKNKNIIIYVIMSVIIIILTILLLNTKKDSYTIWIAYKDDKVNMIDHIDVNGNAITKTDDENPYYLFIDNDYTFYFIKKGLLYNGSYRIEDDRIWFDVLNEDSSLSFNCDYDKESITNCEGVANRFTRLNK